jgi:hypothetical protein
LTRYLVDGDKEAFKQALLLSFVNGECKSFDVGQQVYLEDTAVFIKSVARRIVDRRVLHLIKMWLECPVEAGVRSSKGRSRLFLDEHRGGQLISYET